MSFIIKSTWSTPNLYWDGGMWKPSEFRARRFPTRKAAEDYLSGMTWADRSLPQDDPEYIKPVTDAKIIEIAQ